MTYPVDIKKLFMGICAYVVATFGAQALSHFVINADHYKQFSFIREQPIFIFGFLSMFIQGAIFTHLFQIYTGGKTTLKDGWLYGMLIAPLIGSYIILAEPAKYKILDIPSWMVVEFAAAFVQFSLFGIFLALIFRKID